MKTTLSTPDTALAAPPPAGQHSPALPVAAQSYRYRPSLSLRQMLKPLSPYHHLNHGKCFHNTSTPAAKTSAAVMRRTVSISKREALIRAPICPPKNTTIQSKPILL